MTAFAVSFGQITVSDPLSLSLDGRSALRRVSAPNSACIHGRTPGYWRAYGDGGRKEKCHRWVGGETTEFMIHALNYS